MEENHEKAEKVFNEVMQRTGGVEKAFKELIQTEPFKSYLEQEEIREAKEKGDFVRALKVTVIVAIAVGITVWLMTGSIIEALASAFVAVFFIVITNILGWL